jgi:starch phosphorylase
VETLTDFDGRVHYRWAGGEIMNARAVDMPVVGAPDPDGQSTVNTLRLWDAEPVQAVDFAAFSRGDHHGGLSAQTSAAALTSVLYPEDSNDAGKALRLRQQHFMVSATVQDLVTRHEQRHGSLDSFADKNAIQINDTHPALAIPELMRVLMDDKGMSWDKAWGITQRTVAYTNHTLLPEALEKWDGGLFRNLLPRHHDIVCEVNRRFLVDVNQRLGASGERDERISILGQDGSVRMGNLAVVGSHSVNGVAKLHSDLVQSKLFPDYAALWPEKFGNVTNGVTTDRWIEQANPGLTSVFNGLAPGWQYDPSLLTQQAHRATEPEVQASFAEVKQNNKQNLADHIKTTLGLSVNPEALFDVQIKRQHEYKRQLLNVLHVIDMYDAIVEGRDTAPCVPVVKIIAGKAAPGYHMAKLILQLANAVARKVNNDPRVGDRLKVAILPNYNVSLAEKIVPAADLSEQISTAGTEASGTGNMKMSMNGALTIGTLDGANVEIREAVGAENFFLFGLSTQEVERTLRRGYNSGPVIRGNQRLERAVSLIDSGTFSPLGEPHRFGDIVNMLHHHDCYLNTADFASYMEAQHRAQEAYADKEEWGRMSVTNALNTVAPFSSTRAIQDYAQRIWHTEPVPPAPRVQAGSKAALAAAGPR